MLDTAGRPSNRPDASRFKQCASDHAYLACTAILCIFLWVISAFLWRTLTGPSALLWPFHCRLASAQIGYIYLRELQRKGRAAIESRFNTIAAK